MNIISKESIVNHWNTLGLSGNTYSESILEEIDISDIERFLRKKKLEK